MAAHTDAKPPLLEAHYLPTVQYCSHLAKTEVAYLEARENFQKSTYRNRCVIAGANGPLTLSIPLASGKNEQMPIREVRISTDTDWNRRHWQAIRSAYGRSPYFEFYADELAPLYERPATFLFDWNRQLTQFLIESFRLPVELRLTEEFHPLGAETFDDLRGVIHPKPHRIRRPDDFTARPYTQVFSERFGFQSNLSALDLLCCLGPEAARVLVAGN